MLQDASSGATLAEGLKSWLKRMASGLGIDLMLTLSRQPYLADRGNGLVDVVFEGRPDSKLWRDWMVSFARYIEETVPGMQRQGFWDLVANKPNPASLPRASN
jgi:hypothetical protein